MDLLHAQHQSVNQTWPVIVTFRPAPLSRYIYKVSRAWVGIVGKYKVTKIVCLTQQTAIPVKSTDFGSSLPIFLPSYRQPTDLPQSTDFYWFFRGSTEF